MHKERKKEIKERKKGVIHKMWITISIRSKEPLNLFGEHQPYPVNTGSKFLSEYQLFKLKNLYQKSSDKNRCCKKCEHAIKKVYHGKTYYKCVLMGISYSEATDIRLSYVCEEFAPKLKYLNNKETK